MLLDSNIEIETTCYQTNQHGTVVVQNTPEHIFSFQFQLKAWAVCQKVLTLGCHLKLPPHNADSQEVGNMKHQRLISGCVHCICPHNVNKAHTTLALKPTGDVTRNPKQGYHCHQNRTCEGISQQNFKFKKKSAINFPVLPWWQLLCYI